MLVHFITLLWHFFIHYGSFCATFPSLFLSIFNQILLALGASPSEQSNGIASLLSFLLDTAAKKIQSETANQLLVARLRQTFSRHFRNDESNRPRQWKEGVDIDAIFDNAIGITRGQLTLFSRPMINADAIADIADHVGGTGTGDLVDKSVANDIKFGESRVLETWEMVKSDADAQFNAAKQAMESSGLRLPTWVYIVFLFLGYDEVIGVLRNPFQYFVMILVVRKLNWVCIG